MVKVSTFKGDVSARYVDVFNKFSSFILLFFFCCLSAAQAQTIKGIITSDSGDPLIGATVVQKGVQNGVVTDLDGTYSIDVKLGDKTLIFTYIGYLSQEIPINGRTTINITLSEDITKLEEVVVVGYGSTRKSDLTGSVSSINTKDLAGIPVPRVDQALQGRTAGVQITSANGSPGAGTTIRVRGGNSIVGDNEPLWVIDGIIVGQSFDLNNINTNDIKSIEILKDASSVAIYGSRGANGVVLVTTKSGTSIGSGKPEISIGVSSGVQSILAFPEFLNSAEHTAYTNEDAIFRKTSLPFPVTTGLPDTDWKRLLTRNASLYNVDASIGGSADKGNLNYYVSGNIFSQDGIILNSGIDKYIFRSNLDLKLSDKLKAGFRLNFSRLDRDNGTVGYNTLLTNLPQRAVRDAEGKFTGVDPISGSVASNPVANAELNTDKTITNNLLSTIYLEYQPIKNLIIRSTFNPEINNTKRNEFNSSQSPEFLAVGDKGNAAINTLNGFGWNNENTIQYSTNFNKKHDFVLLGGASAQKYSAELTNITAFGISSDATGFNNLALGSDPTRTVVGTGYDGFQIVSFFGRLNYTLNKKYLFTLVGRSDGSSRFAEGNKYAFFPSAAFAYRLGEEKFIQNLGIFNDLKFRASYGRSGSQAIDSYRTLAVLEDARTSYNGVLTSGSTLGRPANESLKWETTNQLDIALEASFFKGRLSTEIGVYNKITNDLLLNVRLPKQSGFESRLQNLGQIQNKGFELLINSVNYAKKDFTWNTTLTLSANRNSVLDLGGVDFIDIVSATNQNGPGGRLLLNEPAPVFTGVNFLGTWKTQEDIVKSKQLQQILGGPRFDDPNGDGQITPNEFYVLGSPQPDFIYGLQNSFGYKNFDFSFFFQGTQGNEVFNSMTMNAYFTRGEAQKYKEVVNRWTPTNNTSDVVGVGYLGGVPSNSFMIEDGSHLRLKAARLAYNLSLNNASFKRMTVSITGNNLYLWSKFRLIDPETSQFNKNSANGNVAQGFSAAEYPSSRSVNMGINVTF